MWNIMKIESMPGYNVRSVKKDTKRSSVLLLCLVSFFTEQTLLHVLIIINNRPPSHGTHRNWLYSQFVLQLLLESFLSILYCAGVFQKDKRKRMSGVLFFYLIYRLIFLNHHKDSQKQRVAKVIRNFGWKYSSCCIKYFFEHIFSIQQVLTGITQ